MKPDQKTASIRQALAVAAQHRQAGRLAQAATICHEILKADPRSADAFYLLAAIAQDSGQTDSALVFLSKAVAQNPRNAAYHSSLGAVLRSQGRLAEAMTAYQTALSIRSDYPEAYLGTGNLHRDQGNRHEAEACYRKAVELKPDFTPALSNLGALLQMQGDLDAANACYAKVLELNPNAPETLNNLGVIEKEQGNHEAAVGYYQRALELRPGYVEACYNLGNAYKDLGRSAEAAACYEKAVELNPDYADAYINLGNLHKDAGSVEKALAYYRRALALKPSSAEAHHNTGTVLREHGKLAEAAEWYRKALALDPNFAEAQASLGNVLQEQGKLDEAIKHYREALRIKPDSAQARYLLAHQLQMVCEWPELPALSQWLRDTVRAGLDTAIDPLALVALGASPEEQLACANLASTKISSVCTNMGFVFGRMPKPKLRVGYLSGDFRTHVVAVLTSELFELHDRGKFDIAAYSYGPNDHSAMRKRLENAFDRFVDIRDLSYVEAAQRIHSDGIDILVDLTGYTKGTRSHIMALKPAPVQANYLGFPGTLGIDSVDYIIADRFLIPLESAQFYVEKPVYLPHTWQVNDRTRAVGPPASRAQCGLPEDAFVFCCFNQSYKITPEVFDVWMRILQQAPGSLLWLSAANRWAVENLQREAQARGVNPDRLVFAPKLPRIEDHLARIPLADLFLDTLTYNAHATASDALWMGLPVLTCAGETFASRAAGSLLGAIGLPELITFRREDYEALALELARNRGKLLELRARLKKNRDAAPLFDTPRFTAHLEKAYEMMWERFCSGLPAGVIEVPAQ